MPCFANIRKSTACATFDSTSGRVVLTGDGPNKLITHVAFGILRPEKICYIMQYDTSISTSAGFDAIMDLVALEKEVI